MLASLGLGRGCTTEVAAVTFLTPTGLIPGKMSWRCCEKQGTKTLPLTMFVWVRVTTVTGTWWKENLTCARFVDQRAPSHTTTWALRTKCKCFAQMLSSVSRWLPTGKRKITASTVQEDGCHARKSGMVPGKYTAGAYLTQGVLLN